MIFSFRERPPGLIQHVLTVLVSGPGCYSCPAFRLRLGASDCSPGLAFCFMGSWTFAWICCPQLPYHPCKNGMHSTCFYSTGGHTPILRIYLGILHWKMAGFFGEFFLVSVSQETKHKNSWKIRGKFGAKFGAKCGMKIWKIRETFVLQLFWPNNFQERRTLSSNDAYCPRRNYYRINSGKGGSNNF